MILRLFSVILTISGILAVTSDLNDQNLPSGLKSASSLLETTRKLRQTQPDSSFVINNFITLKLLEIETKIDKLATTVESIQNTISDCKANRQGSSNICISKPLSPIILPGLRNYALVEVKTAIRYKEAVTKKDDVDVQLDWSVLPDSCPTLNSSIYLDDTIIAWKGNGMETSATFKVHKGGNYEIKLEFCNQNGCTSNSTRILVADTDGSHHKKGILTPPPDMFSITNKVVGAYYTDESILHNYTVNAIHADKLTHLMYGFLAMCGSEGINDSGDYEYYGPLQLSCDKQDDFQVSIQDLYSAFYSNPRHSLKYDPYKGNFRDLMIHKFTFPHLKILASIGGPFFSSPFKFFNNETNLETFTDSVKEFLETWKFFDGIDIHWRYPRLQDGKVYAQVLKKLRQTMDQLSNETGKKYVLTAAIGTDDDEIGSINYKEVQEYVDHFYVLTYDFYGPWTLTPGHQANLYAPDWNPKAKSVDKITKYLLSQGLSAQKIVIGVTTHGRGWSGLYNYTDNPFKGQATGSFLYRLGSINYEGIKKLISNGDWEYHYDNTAEAPYIFKNKTKELITYDDAKSTFAKRKYVKEKGLKGLFAWQVEVKGFDDDIVDYMSEGTDK